MSKSPWLQNLLHRRVPQIMGAYIGAGLAVIPFFGFLVDTYDFPKLLLDAVFVAYVSMIPSVFLLAYNHGAPGKDPWGKAERVGIPIRESGGRRWVEPASLHGHLLEVRSA